MTKRAALYLRQSKSSEAGIDRQRERTQQLAEAKGWTLVGEYADNDVSASKVRGARTAWGRMLADATAGTIDVVVALDLDRLLRTTRDLNTLIDHGLQVVTVDGELDLTTADGEFRATMLASIARFEVRRKGERQTRANAQRAAGGGVPKGVRLTGYATDGSVVEDEARVVRALFAGFAAGDTLRSLSREHDRTPSTVRTILTNPRYAGRRVYKGEVVGTGSWEAIVDGSTFDLVQRRLSDPRRQTNRTGSTARKALGTSLFRCECGESVRTAGSGGRYWCRACGLVRTMAPVDDFVLRVLQRRLQQPDAERPADDAAPLREEARSLRERRDGLASLLARGLMGLDAVEEQASALTAQIEDVERRIDAAAGPSRVLAESDTAHVASLSLDRQRALVDALVVVTLHRGVRGRRGFDPDSVTLEWR